MDLASDTAIEAAIKALAETKGLGFGDYQAVARLAVSGTNAGPSITSIFRVLGLVRVQTRLARFLQAALAQRERGVRSAVVGCGFCTRAAPEKWAILLAC